MPDSKHEFRSAKIFCGKPENYFKNREIFLRRAAPNLGYHCSGGGARKNMVAHYTLLK